MIAKDSTTTVNFYAMNTDGTPAVGQASNITATISINSSTATAISDTITEVGSGWYRFNHTFNTVGNVFIVFNCTGCIIPPWEDDVVEVTGVSASDIAYAVWSDKRTYPMFQGTPMGYYQANPPIINVWGQKPWPQENTTYGDLVKSIPTVNTNVSAVKAKTDNLPTSPAATGDAMTLTSAAITAVQSGLSTFNAVSDTVTINATQAATMVTATGFATPTNITAAQTAIINAMPSTSGLATSSDVSTAQSAIISAMPDVSGLSTFNPSTDNVNVSSTSISSIQSGLATASNVSSAQSAIIAAMPDISGLSTFDPVNDTVLIDSTQAASMATATGFATPANVTAAQTAIINAMPDVSGLSTFDAANDTVTINSTQAATMTTATGFATPTNVTDAVSALETYGDAHWTGGGSGGGGITAEDVWKYSGTYGRSLTVSPTDISSLATKTDLTTAQTAIVNAMPSTAGLATATNVSDAKADIIAAIPDISGLSTFNAATDTVVIDSTQAATMTTATGFATPANITAAQTAIINAMPDVSGLSTFDPSTDTVILASAQTDAIASSVWSDTTIYTGNSKGNRLSGIYNTVQNIPGQVWMVDADYGATIQGTMGQAIYNMFNDHATATDVSVVADLLEQIDAGVLHWSTTATRLTLYKEDNSVLRVYALERDADGNITRINPVA